MSTPLRPLAFVLAATNMGSMIVNRHDFQRVSDREGYGVGFQLLNTANYEPEEVHLALMMLDVRRQFFGGGVVGLDVGANIGVHTIQWAHHMTGWGSVQGFEPQQFVYYALAGNVVLNNCLNARVWHAAVGETCGQIDVPFLDVTAPASFGSLELRLHANNEPIGQPVNYAPSACTKVPLVSLDSLELARLDLMKIDVEGMESDVLRGGRSTLARCRPILIVEHGKSGAASLEALLVEMGYRCFPAGQNLLAVQTSDPSLSILAAAYAQTKDKEAARPPSSPAIVS
jgi:FkbM family methyltransferase